MPHLIKRDGRREPFDEEKLRYGLSKALEKRPVSVDEIETSVNHIKHKLVLDVVHGCFDLVDADRALLQRLG